MGGDNGGDLAASFSGNVVNSLSDSPDIPLSVNTAVDHKMSIFFGRSFADWKR
jgi:hypothetical protein